MHNGRVRHSVTIRDVARLAKVHPGTVSRALNPDTRALVNAATAERVADAAAQLGYQPNPIARGLKTNRSFTVGVLVPDITNPLFPPILRGIEDRLSRSGYTTLIVNTDNDSERERAALETMRARHVDGFITATARLEERVLSGFALSGTPIVLVNRGLEDGSLPMVGVDDRAGTLLAVEHVSSLGHRQIGHVAGPQDTSTGHQRYLGFLDAVASCGLDVEACPVSFASAFTEAGGARACAELFADGRELTAIVAANDLLALGCYDVLAQRGMRCPEDLSVVGFNDIPFIDRLRPPLTSVRVPQRDIGAAAGDLLLECLADPAAGRQIWLEPTLVVRGSTAAPRDPRRGSGTERLPA
jgi:LacI family transcriptional regulator